MKRLIVMVCLCFFVSGCLNNFSLQSESLDANGKPLKYKVSVSTFWQDFKTSDIAVSLDPKGKTTLKAGAMETQETLTAEAIGKMTDILLKVLQQYAEQQSKQN